MSALPLAARWYIIGLWLVAAAASSVALGLSAGDPPNPLLLLAVLIGFMLADYFVVDFEIKDGELVSMTVADTALMFLIPATGAYGVLVVSLGSLCSDVIHRTVWYKALFNAAQRAITYLVMLAAYLLIVGPTVAAYAGWQGMLGLLVIAALNTTLNPLLVSAIVALVSGQPLRQVYLSSVSRIHWVFLLTLPLGALLAVAWEHSPWLVIPGVVPVVIAHRSFTTMAALQAEGRRSRRLAEKLERLHDATTAMLASHEPIPLLRTVSSRLAALLEARRGWAVLLDGSPELVAAAPPSGPWDPAAYAEELGHHEIRHLEGAALARLHPPPELGDARLTLIPMLAEGRLIGGFALALDQPTRLADDDGRVLLAFAGQAALAVERAQLFEQLRTKQEELIRSSKLAALGTFASGIAHEFNNLLAVVAGFAELGLSSADTAEKDEALEMALRSSLRGRSITSGLLTFARQRNGDREPARLDAVVAETIDLVQREFAKTNITIVRALEPVRTTVCDAGQIAQVLMNLLTNARDALAERQSATITVALAEQGETLILRVSDNGSGIPESLMPHIFQPFMTTKGASGGRQGTGLGLAIGYGIVESHGGEIQVESAVGRGTTFTVRLPIVAPPVSPSDTRPEMPPPVGLRLLIIDDEPEIGAALRRHLEQRGCEVVVATSGQEALASYRARPFDLVLSDVIMPGMGGVELLLALRAIDPQVRVLAMSGNASTREAQQMVELGVVDMVRKPFKAEELLRLIRRSLTVSPVPLLK